MWRLEADPRLRSTMTVVDNPRLRARLGPPARRPRLGEPADPALPPARGRAAARASACRRGWPTATSTCASTCGRLRVAAPGSRRQACSISSRPTRWAPFDRSRPPWRPPSLVEGPRGRFAPRTCSSSITASPTARAGRSSVGLLHSPQAQALPRQADARPRHRRRTPRALGILAEQLVAGRAPRCRALAVAAGRGDALAGAQRLAHAPVGRRLATPWASPARSSACSPPPPAAPLAAARRPGGRSWRFDAIEVPLDELKAAGRRRGRVHSTTRNIAALLGGFRRYHEAVRRSDRGHADGDCRSALRSGDHPMGGKPLRPVRASPRRSASPDPAERIRLVHEFVRGTCARRPALDALGPRRPRS